MKLLFWKIRHGGGARIDPHRWGDHRVRCGRHRVTDTGPGRGRILCTKLKTAWPYAESTNKAAPTTLVGTRPCAAPNKHQASLCRLRRRSPVRSDDLEKVIEGWNRMVNSAEW